MRKSVFAIAACGVALYLLGVLAAMQVATQPVFETVVPKSGPGGLALGDSRGPSAPELSEIARSAHPDPGAVARLPVFDSGGVHVGRVARVTMGPDGRIKWIDVETGGFLGLGSRTVRIGFAAFQVETGRIQVALTGPEIEQLPEAEDGPR